MWLVLVGYKAQFLWLDSLSNLRCKFPQAREQADSLFSNFSFVCEYAGANKTNKTMIDLVCLLVVVSDCITSSSLNSYHSNEKYLWGFRDFQGHKCIILSKKYPRKKWLGEDHTGLLLWMVFLCVHQDIITVPTHSHTCSLLLYLHLPRLIGIVYWTNLLPSLTRLRQTQKKMPCLSTVPFLCCRNQPDIYLMSSFFFFFSHLININWSLVVSVQLNEVLHVWNNHIADEVDTVTALFGFFSCCYLINAFSSFS